MPEVRLVQLRVGSVQTRDGLRSAIFKEAVAGPLWAGAEGLVGDEVADRKHHGGPDQALLGYPAEHYGRWASEGRPFEVGAFGENLLLEGLLESEACIGDVLEGAEVRLQISQPRVPCGTLAKRLASEGSLQRVWETGRGGYYLRVLQEGWIRPGEVLRRGARPHPEWSVLRALHARWKAGERPEEALSLAQLPELSADWRERLPRQLQGQG